MARCCGNSRVRNSDARNVFLVQQCSLAQKGEIYLRLCQRDFAENGSPVLRSARDAIRNDSTSKELVNQDFEQHRTFLRVRSEDRSNQILDIVGCFLVIRESIVVVADAPTRLSSNGQVERERKAHL